MNAIRDSTAGLLPQTNVLKALGAGKDSRAPQWCSLFRIALAMVCAFFATANAADSDNRFTQAERWLSWNAMALVVGGQAQPHWLADGDRFWFRKTESTGTSFVLVDPVQASQQSLFAREGMARALVAASTLPVDPADLPLISIDEQLDEHRVSVRTARFLVADNVWRCSLKVPYRCALARTDVTAAENVSPDGRSIAYLQEDNLFVRPAGGGTPIQLTHDSEPYYGVPRRGISRDEVSDTIRRQRLGELPPDVIWSPDSKRLLTWMVDRRGIRKLPMIQSIPRSGRIAPRPQLFTWPQAWAGDEDIGSIETVIFDITGAKLWQAPRLPNWNTGEACSEKGWAWWDGPNRAYWLYAERGGLKVSLQTLDLGAAVPAQQELYHESAASPVHVCPDYYCSANTVNVRVLAGGRKLLWWSERDGWAHLYLIDAVSGKIDRQLTHGNWTVLNVVAVDESSGVLYFTAGGREAGRDPYLRRLYSTRMDRVAEPLLLTPENAYHFESNSLREAFSPSHRFFVDTYSAFDTPPTTVLRRADGRFVMTLASADTSALQSAGWVAPRQFKVKAADGFTDLYGQLYLPTNFDPEKHYPVAIDYYPGPFTNHVRKRFGLRDTDEQPQATAEVGFVVVELDARGTSYRSRAFRDFSYGNMGIAEIVDYVSALRQLGSQFRFMDLNRIGIYAISAGADLAIPAVASYPEVFKVAVVSGLSGISYVTHAPFYGETWLGLPAANKSNWERADNSHWITNVRDGSLFILQGEMDDHSSPTAGMQVLDALVTANKQFNYISLPNVNHDGRDMTDAKLAYSLKFFEYRFRFLVDKLGLPH